MNKLLKASLCGAIFSTLLAPVYVTHAMDTSDNNIVVITASKREETIKNSPAAVQVITQSDMKRLGADTVESALQLADNINLSGNDSWYGITPFPCTRKRPSLSR